ncbi:hypothetical protein [Gaoshiqia sp. Z1-71]|uniref:hypothetical protein n=1 Tax=Gaoshiqia hydrogeniformans TaxID=3290090 RepID=UPI003BF8022E
MRLIFLIALSLFSAAAFAQKPEYQVGFHGFGDNREYFSGKAYSQTILGERTSFEIGTTLDENHRFRIGLNHLFEFGSEADVWKPKLTAYYRYSDEQNEFYFGAFPRMDLVDFPLAMLTDTLLYYRPNIEGMYGKHSWSWGHQSGFVDWTSRQSETQRETFMAGLSGKMHLGSWFSENYLLLYHHAKSAVEIPDEHIKDNLGFALYAGRSLDQFIPLENSYLKIGLLQSTFRDRGNDDGFVTNRSFVSELYGELKPFALRATFHQGNGHRFMYGDRFYDADSYLRTDIYWKFLNSEHVQGRFNLSFHLIEGNDLDQSQQLSLIYRFGN